MSISDQIDAYHEPPPQLLAERQSAFVEVHRRPKEYLAILRRARRAPLVHTALRQKVYVETSPRLTFFAPVIYDALPNSKFVFIHRHPGDVVRSGMRRNWYNGHAADQWRITPPLGSREAGCWASWSQFEKICWYWKAYNRFALDFVNGHDEQRICILPFNVFVSADVAAFRELFSFIGVSPPSKDAIESVVNRKFNRQVDGAFPHYSEWSDGQRKRLTEICEPEMSELGYSL